MALAVQQTSSTYHYDYEKVTTSTGMVGFQNLPIGTASADRRVIVWLEMNYYPSTVRIGGIDATIDVASQQIDNAVGWWHLIITAVVPTGTTTYVEVNDVGSTYLYNGLVFTVTGETSRVRDTYEEAYSWADPPPTMSGPITVGADGVVLGFAYYKDDNAANATTTWDGLDPAETIDTDAGGEQFSFGAKEFTEEAVDLTVTAQAPDSNFNINFLLVSYDPPYVNVPSTGTNATAWVETVSVVTETIIPATGTSATTAMSSVEAQTGITFTETGLVSYGEMGSVTVATVRNIEAEPTTVSASAVMGSVTVITEAILSAVGASATASLTDVDVDFGATVSLTGDSASAVMGSVTTFEQTNIMVEGIAASSETGEVGFILDMEVTLSGVGMAGNTNDVQIGLWLVLEDGSTEQWVRL